MKKNNTIEFLGVEINFRTTLKIKELMGVINIGGITLKKDDREYMLDPSETFFTHPDGGGTLAYCELDSFENTLDIFDDCKFDLTDADFMNRKFDTAEMFLEFEDHAKEDYASDIESITLFYKSGDCTIAVDLEPETFTLVD